VHRNGSAPDNIDTQRLRRLYRSDESAKAVFDHLAKRERSRKELAVERLAINIANEGSKASRADVMRVLKELERAGCGKYIPGRKGHQSRFSWDVDMVAVGRNAAGQDTPIEQVDAATLAEDDSTEGVSVDGEVTHSFRLRPDLSVDLKLPSDLTSTEATRLADFVRTLPF
jgi:hypothetical protein